MSRSTIGRESAAETAVTGLYADLTRRLASGAAGNCPVEQCRAFVEMCLAQSCGKCVPCRIGLKQISDILDRILDGDGKESDTDTLGELASAIRDSADCAIGFEAAATVSKMLKASSADLRAHIAGGKCTAAFEPVPCKGGCPAHVDIPGYIALAGEGRFKDALRLIRYDNPFPAVCALICEHPCENFCRRTVVDDAVNIRGLKRMIVENAGNVAVPACLPATGKKIAVIGGGPSGLTAAYYLQLMGHECTVFEQRDRLGGMTRYGIPRYRLPDSWLDRDIDAVLSTGVKAHTGVSIGTGEFEKLKKEYDAVYISIGAQGANTLGIKGEDAGNVISAVELLRAMGDGNAPDFTGKRVVIVGGGNVAMDCTRTSVRLGASEVKCVYRRRQADMTALPEEIEGAIAETCEIVTMKSPVKVEKDENGNVAALVVRPQIPGGYDRGRPRPVAADLPMERIECDIIICAIGQAIVSDPFEAAGVPAKRGRFGADNGCRIAGDTVIYAGGDCLSGPSTVVRAVEAGKTAAANIDEALGFAHVLERTVVIPEPKAEPVGPTGRIVLGERSASERKDDFDIMERPMTAEECTRECARCLRCDCHGMGTVKGARAKW